MRFSNQDLRKIVEILAELATQFSKVEEIFKTLPNTAKKAKLKNAVPAADTPDAKIDETEDAKLTIPFHQESVSYVLGCEMNAFDSTSKSIPHTCSSVCARFCKPNSSKVL